MENILDLMLFELVDTNWNTPLAYSL